LSNIPLAIWDDLIKILQGAIPTGTDQIISFYGLPPIVIAAIPFIVGLVLGILIKRALKLVITLALVAVVALYLGVVSWGTLNAYLEKVYANIPLAIHYAALLFAMLPLGLGFVVGLLVGLRFG